MFADHAVSYASQENLALRPGVTVVVSVANPTGRGARDPRVLINETAYRLDMQPLSTFLNYRRKTYDTYDGHNQSTGPDWYAIHFPHAVALNCVDMTMECAHRDGGWWTSLWVEIQEEPGRDWCVVSNFTILPDYSFKDAAYGRSSYVTYALKFDATSACAVRVIGQPGGLAQFTSVARLAVYHRNFAHWDPSQLPGPQVPYIFHLIHPNTIWDLSESLVKLTGLAVSVRAMDHYLDRERYERWWRRISRIYTGEPELWFLVGASIGWEEYYHVGVEQEDYSRSPKTPYVRIALHNTLACAVAPIVVDGQVLAEMTSHTVILSDSLDISWHRSYAMEHAIAWEDYEAAIGRSPKMTYEQLEGAATLMGMIANTIANLAHQNLALKREVSEVQGAKGQQAKERQQLVARAMAVMHERLEEGVSVEDVAKAVAVSSTFLGSMFMEQLGTGPLHILNEMRIERAKQYLVHTDMSVLDVSLALGFNPNYFSRFFKQHTGYLPRDYIKRMRQRR